MRKCVYAASLDPITNGHLWVIEQGARLFDELVVAIGTNPGKQYTFTLDERMEVLRASTAHFPNVTVDSYVNQFLVNYQYMLRGSRSEADFAYERSMMLINIDLDPTITTVFLQPPRELAEISSSMLKSLVGPIGWQAIVRPYVPEPVYQLLLRKFCK